MLLPIFAQHLSLPIAPGIFWSWGIVTLITALLVGFLAGAAWARHSEKRLVSSLSHNPRALSQCVERRLTAAEEACAALAESPEYRVSEPQARQLHTWHERFSSLLPRLWQTPSEPPSSVHVPVAPVMFDPAQVSWIKTPADALTHLPDATTVDANLELLLNLSHKAQQTCGLILVRCDRLDDLRGRLGAAEADYLWKRFVVVTCQAIRDIDFVCLQNQHTMAVLLPQVTSQMGARLAENLRTTLRNYRFMLSDQSTEVLVTASLGYTTCAVDDNSDLALNRAVDALTRSQRRGRNQLHVHNGRGVVHAG